MKFITIVITIACYGSSFVYASLFENIEGQDRVLVKFKTGASELNCKEAMEASGSEVIEKIVTAAMIEAGDVEGVTLMKTDTTVPEAIEAILLCEAIEYAEPNYIYTLGAISNDPYVTDGSLWGMCSSTATGGGVANQYGIGATTMWQNDKTDCGDVYVGIIDEGYMLTHEDLVANAGTNPGEIPDDGLDNDGNGYIDDVNGWDFWNDDNTVYDPADGDEHGTHVAGTIGAMGGNGKGVAGVCWDVKLMSGKFLGPNCSLMRSSVRMMRVSCSSHQEATLVPTMILPHITHRVTQTTTLSQSRRSHRLAFSPHSRITARPLSTLGHRGATFGPRYLADIVRIKAHRWRRHM